MPEYLAPGVYVEETSFRSKSIEGVSTTTTGFVGPARYGPIDLDPEIITSLVEYERIYGDRGQLVFDGAASHNYLWQAVRAFFEEGGKRLYIGRIFRALLRPAALSVPPYERPPDNIVDDGTVDDQDADGDYFDGHGRVLLSRDGSTAAADSVLIRARFPGAAGNLRVRIRGTLGQNMLAVEGEGADQRLTVGSLRDYDTVWLDDLSSPIGSPPSGGSLYVARFNDAEQTWIFSQTDTPSASDYRLNSATAANVIGASDRIRVVTLTVTITTTDGSTTNVWDNVALDPNHKSTFGAPDSLKDLFAQNPNSMSQARWLPVVVLTGDDIDTGRDLLQALASTSYDSLLASLANDDSTDVERTIDTRLTRGNDGQRPTAIDYEGNIDDGTNQKFGLKSLRTRKTSQSSPRPAPLPATTTTGRTPTPLSMR